MSTWVFYLFVVAAILAGFFTKVHEFTAIGMALLFGAFWEWKLFPVEKVINKVKAWKGKIF